MRRRRTKGKVGRQEFACVRVAAGYTHPQVAARRPRGSAVLGEPPGPFFTSRAPQVVPMPRSLLLLAALLVLPLLASDAPKENGGAAAQSDGLEGTWEAVDSMGQMLTYRHGRFTISLNGDAKAGTYITDLRRTPRRLDEIPDP